MRVERCFGFIDICGFTEFTERHGDDRVVIVLAELRTALREVAARRGVRVVKWLGDGAMVSSTMTDAVIALVVEIDAKMTKAIPSLALRAGLDAGPVIMFEGDDYIGRCVNTAARLCGAAGPGVVLATREVATQRPSWVDASDERVLSLKGFEATTAVTRLSLASAGDDFEDSVCGLVIPAAAAVIDATGDRFCSLACSLAAR